MYPGSPPCPRHQRTQLDFEMCAEQREVELNLRFDRLVAALWPILDATGRAEFARGQAGWAQYQKEECDVGAREFLGGSEAPLAGEECRVGLIRARVTEVSGMLTMYCQGKVLTGPYRRCPRQ